MLPRLSVPPIYTLSPTIPQTNFARKESLCDCYPYNEPPVIGNYTRNKNSYRNQNTARKDGGSRWQSIPPGKDVCMISGPKLHRSKSYQRQHHQSTNEIPGLAKNQYYNLMWDPRIARGPNLVQFTTVQREKCKREHDLDHMLFRRRRRHTNGGNNTNPARQLTFPNIKIEKEELSYESFLPFLTEVSEVTTKDSAQSMYDDWPSCCNKPGTGPWKKIPSGISTSTQTDIRPCRQETSSWIVKTLSEKIPQQVVLELAEEAEIERIGGERQRHEMVLLYRQWQKMRQDQWNGYLQAWNELRMGEINDEASYLADQQERLGVIAFAKSATNCCFIQTFENMKVDKFINKEGVPYEELEVIDEIMEINSSNEKAYANEQLARTFVDSTLARAVAQRFAEHMNDEYGRPHGIWFTPEHQRDRHAPNYISSVVEYDEGLRRYLEGRGGTRRRGSHGADGSDGVDTDCCMSFLDIHDFKLEHVSGANGREKRDEHSDPDNPQIAVENALENPQTNMGNDTFVDTERSQDDRNHTTQPGPDADDYRVEDDVAILYQRNPVWSNIEMDDHNHQSDSPGENAKGSILRKSLDEKTGEYK